jgi:hypothetical protein
MHNRLILNLYASSIDAAVEFWHLNLTRPPAIMTSLILHIQVNNYTDVSVHLAMATLIDSHWWRKTLFKNQLPTTTVDGGSAPLDALAAFKRGLVAGRGAMWYRQRRVLFGLRRHWNRCVRRGRGHFGLRHPSLFQDGGRRVRC